MNEYLLVMAMMAIALIAVLIVYVLDRDEPPESDEGSSIDDSIT